jgi:magnesium-protoporphyrin O-methyltransferase
MQTATYQRRRGQLETYFDRTAVEGWKRLTSDAPVGRIRATVRAGRDEMRATLLSWLPDDLRGARLLDAGCGGGALAIEAAKRGAHVVAVDLSAQMVALAGERAPRDLKGRVEFHVGDMLAPSFGRFDFAVAMDSLIHYAPDDATRALGGLSSRVDRAILFTFAPRTPMLAMMHAAGRLFPRSDRAPAIEPVAESALRKLIAASAALGGWRAGRTRRVASGFYTSQAMELRKA